MSQSGSTQEPRFPEFNKIAKQNIFRAISAARNAAGVQARTKQSYKWVQNKIKDLEKSQSINARDVMKIRQYKADGKKIIGRMYMYSYDPKWKKELPYYDTFPMVFPFNIKNDRIQGLNLHYLPIPLRVRLFDALLTYASNRSFDETTRLRLNYSLLSGVAKMKIAKPCIKEYLNTQFRSIPREIPADEWDIALFLPIARWKKATEAQVWADARKAAR